METRFSALDRGSLLKELSEETWDVLVIGGGITGAGIALDAQSRGMKTALIEMQDFAAGTSSRSTKLVHGGLRYLKQFEVKMVAEVGRERAVVYENGPHVTTPEWMLLPIYKGGTFGKLSTSIGLAVYDRLAGVKLRERRRMLGVEAALAKEPLLRKEGLKGGGYYVEYRTDDARLTIEVMKKAAELGAKAVNYVKAEELLYENGRICGVRAADVIGGRACVVKARHIVNATGPWVDGIRELDGSRQGKTLRLTKGIHLVFDGSRFPLRQAVYFDTPDGRMMFAIPRDGKTYVGTTDTDYDGDAAAPKMTEADRKYVVEAAAAMFPSLGLTEADVESSWAGLRPLIYEEGKSPSEVSRRDEVFRSDSGLLTIAGGKLTGYRRMAETVTDMLAAELGRESGRKYPRCRTKDIPLSGGDVGGSSGFPGFRKQSEAMGRMQGLSGSAAALIAGRYGSNAGTVYSLLPGAGERPPALRIGGADKLPPEIHAALLYAIRHEMAAKPADFLIRRTGALFFDRASALQWKDAAAAVMARELGYGEETMETFMAELETELRDAVDARPDSAGRTG
ncbi:glycerol-3-phosphate dehydrogenase/oxidase [Paenibacillus sp. D51F]